MADEEITQAEQTLAYTDLLSDAGLSGKEAEVYEILLRHGQMGVSDVLDLVDYKRGDTYNILYSLRDKGVVEQTMKNKKINFKVRHPNSIQDLIEEREEQLELARKEVSAVLPDLKSLYNLAHSRPGVSVFEGKSGIERVVFDSLEAKGEVFSFIDIESVEELIGEFSSKYYKKRLQKRVKKKNLISDTKFSREFARKSADDLTETRVLSGVNKPLQTTMTIYDDKVSYISLKRKAMIGIIIEDKLVSSMQKTLFQKLWDGAKRV